MSMYLTITSLILIFLLIWVIRGYRILSHNMYCHVYVCLYTGFGLLIGFIEQLENVTTNS
jgi:hypothetical protein